MARILNTTKYPFNKPINKNDYLIGTDSVNKLKTKNFKIDDLVEFIKIEANIGESAYRVYDNRQEVSDDYDQGNMYSGVLFYVRTENKIYFIDDKGREKEVEGNLLIFDTYVNAVNYAKNRQGKNGQLIYAEDNDKYYKYYNHDLVDPFSDKLNKPTGTGTITDFPYMVLMNEEGNTIKFKITDIIGQYVPLTRRINTNGGLKGGGTLENDLTISIDEKTLSDISKGVEGYVFSQKMGDADTAIPDWSNELTTKTDF